MRMRNWSSWSTRERWVVGVIVLLTAAVVLAQLNGDSSITSALVYIGFTLVMVGLVLAAAALFRASGQADSGLSTPQKAILAGVVVVLAWAAVDAARMDGGFVPAAFVATAAIGLAYLTAITFGAMAMVRVRNR